MAKTRMSGQRDALSNLHNASARLPRPVSVWFNVLAQDAWRLVLNDSYQYLNQRYQSELYTFWGEDIDFVRHPDLLHENYKYSVRSGVYFWLSNNLFAEADKGAAGSVVDSITRIINESTDSYGRRRDNFKRIFEVEKIFKDI